MAKVYATPASIEAPGIKRDADGRFDLDATTAAENEYVEAVKALAKEWYPADKLAGTVYRIQIADGYASYVVLRSKPLELLHLDNGDGYRAPEAHERGLRVSDIKKQAAYDAAWAAAIAAK